METLNGMAILDELNISNISDCVELVGVMQTATYICELINLEQYYGVLTFGDVLIYVETFTTI